MTSEIPAQFVAPGDPEPEWTAAQKMEAAAAGFLEAAAMDEDDAFQHADGSPSQLPAVPVDAVPRASLPLPKKDAPPPPAAPPRTPLFAGTYAIYDDGTGSGGIVAVVCQTVSAGQPVQDEQHHRISAGMLRMAEKFGGGLVGKMFGGG